MKAALKGKRIVVTRPRAQADVLCERLRAMGAEPIPFPAIRIAPPEDFGPLDRAIAELDSFDWVVFTSVNGVEAFWARLKESEAAGPGPSASSSAAGGGLPARLRVAAIGPATARALAERGVQAEFVPEEYVAESVAAGLPGVAGRRVLLPRADIARRALALHLEARGARVTEAAAYRTLPGEPDETARQALRSPVDAVLFTSSSTVRNFLALAAPPAELPGRPLVACIGPITARTAREAGLRVDVVADSYTVDGIVEALCAHFARPERACQEAA